jgi:hypothetical protein
MSNGIWRSPDGLPCMFPCRFPARRDLDAELRPPPDKNHAFGGIAVAQINAGWSERLPRSARTRRPSRSSRGWTTENVVQKFRSDLDGNERAECRVDYVKHSTSPSRRENAQRAFTSPVFSKPVCRYRTSACPTAAPPHISVCRLQHVHDLRVPNRCIAGKHPGSLCPIPLVRSALDTRAPRREI